MACSNVWKQYEEPVNGEDDLIDISPLLAFQPKKTEINASNEENTSQENNVSKNPQQENNLQEIPEKELEIWRLKEIPEMDEEIR